MIFKCSSSQDSLLGEVNKWFMQLCSSQTQTAVLQSAAIVWLRALGGMSGEGQDYTHCSLDVVAWYPSLPLDGYRVRGEKGGQYRKEKRFFP